MLEAHESPGLTKLLYMLAARTKSSLEKHCAEAVVSQSDLATLIQAGLAGHLDPYRYDRYFSDWVPPDAPPTNEDIAALSTNGDDPAPQVIDRVVRRLSNSARSRRLYAAHLFYEPSGKRWRLIYFTQRDRSRFDNHWAGGPHIHISSEHFTQSDINSVWEAACEKKPSLPKSLHIRYVEDHG